MKTTEKLALLLISAFALPVSAQTAGNIGSGKITYEEKIKLEIKLEGDAGQFASMLPKERKAEKVLTFCPEATLFEDGNSNSDEMTSQADETNGIRIAVMVSDKNKVFTDLKNNKVLDQRDFMNRIFIVERPMPDNSWKMTGNQKEILGFSCMEAYMTDSTNARTTVWFTPRIPVQGGPSSLGNLPGMILEADIHNGSRTYTAKSVEPINDNGFKIEKPKEGKKVTEEEFNKIVAEKMKEMGIENGGSGRGNQVHSTTIVIKR